MSAAASRPAPASRHLLNAGHYPAALAAGGPGQVPDLVEGGRCGVAVLADQAMKTHADDLALARLAGVEHLGVKLDHLGPARRGA